jgi:predicted RNA binding protein with dsRBD fold (UPF0201 family)
VSRRFDLDADVRSARPQEVLAALHDLFPDATIETTETGLRVRAQLEGESARDLNRAVLSALRRVERRTTLRAEWGSGTTVERFFDYVPKGIRTSD